jgi:flagellar hook-length control protein FliK
MTPLMIGNAPSSGAGPAPAGSASNAAGPASSGSAPTGSGSDGADSFASVLAATDPAPVPAANQGQSGSSAKSESPDRPTDQASATALAADFAVAALALPVPVPVPVTPAAAAAWSGNQPAAAGEPATAAQSVVGQLPGSASTPGQTGSTPAARSAVTAISPAPAAAPATTTTATRPVPVPATIADPATSPTVSPPSGPAATPVSAQGFVGGLRTIKPPTQPNTATAGSAQFAAPVASPIEAGSAQPAAGATNVVPVLVANPPVEQRPAPSNKPITPVLTHDPSSVPVLASHPLPRLDNGADTGSDNREHPGNPQPSITPAGSTGFSLADAGNATTTLSQQVAASQPVVTSQPISQPAPAQSATANLPTASQLPVSQQLAGPVLSLRTAGTGSHQLIIALHPAELGPVNLHVKILGDSMAIQLASTSEGAHDALREALPQLRQELQAAGLGNVDLSLDLGGAPSGNHAQAGNQTQAGGQPEAGYQTEQPVKTTPRRSTTTESGLDRWL